MSAHSSTLEDDISDKKMSNIKEDNKATVRDRHKRPDKQLYVPRALRKMANESTVSSHKDELSVKLSQTCMTIDGQLLLKQKENQREVDKISNSLPNITDAEYNNVLSVQMNNGDKVIKDSTLSPSNDEKKSIEVVKMNIVSDKPKNRLCSEESLKEGNSSFLDSKEQINDLVPANNCTEGTEDSWEAKFNDEGDCLDPKLVKELCDITGRIEVTIAKGDYKVYQPLSNDTSKGYENIVELYGFPVEFSTQDLTSAFSAFQSSSYNIKWVDDCHALAIFSSPVIASQALNLNHPFIKVRPLSEGIKESKEKAKFCGHMFEIHKPRPVTSASLARRLVSGALGLKVNASKEQRDMERNMLREAREKKKLKAKQRQDIWNGIVS